MKIKEKSFTLIEIIVVVIIIGILATIGLPQFNKVVEKSRRSEAINILMKMYREYKILVVDQIIDLTYACFINGTTPGELFDPDECNCFPNNPPNRSIVGWNALGFNTNPNGSCMEGNSLNFSYEFIRADDDPRYLYMFSRDGRPLGSDAMHIAVAWRKISNEKIDPGFFEIDPDKWIYINMNTGEIYKSEHYQ